MRRARGERGQILAVVVLALVALLGIAAFAIDVGYAYYAKRQLQAAADAAALAGAQDLPVASTAITTATQYAPPIRREPVDAHLHVPDEVHARRSSRPAATQPPIRTPSSVTGTGAPTRGSRSSSESTTSTSRRTRTPAVPAPRRPSTSSIAIDRTGSMCDRPTDRR